MDADNQPRDTSVVSPYPADGDAADGDVSPRGDGARQEGSQDSLVADEKTETGPELEGKEEPHGDEKSPDDHDDRGTTLYPATFAELCAQTAERANFLLEVSNPWSVVQYYLRTCVCILCPSAVLPRIPGGLTTSDVYIL